MKRRTLLTAGLSYPLVQLLLSADRELVADPHSRLAGPGMNASKINVEDFLADLQRRCYRYFVDAADPQTQLISDRGRTDGSGFSAHCSIAACGFGLAAHGAAAVTGLASYDEAGSRVRSMLHSLVHLAENERGFVYHFINRVDGSRMFDCEASSIDTALMVAGAMHAAETFSDYPEIRSLSDQLYARVDWRWMLGGDNHLHMGWKPEQGFIEHRWDTFSELTILVLLAIGAPESPIPSSCWQAWKRDQVLQHEGEAFLSYPPLFVHQYPTAFFDFRELVSPSGRSYWRNSQIAHLAQIRFMEELGQRHSNLSHYSEDLWGLTSSDSQSGYRDWGGPYQSGQAEPERGIDGTIVPSAAAGGLAIVPDQAIQTLAYQREQFGESIYGPYGFVNAFNPANGWVNQDVIGIDTGISFLMAENLRTGQIWDAFMRHEAAQRALRLAGFRKRKTPPA